MDGIPRSNKAVFLWGSKRISHPFLRSRATGRVHQRNEDIRRRWNGFAAFRTARPPCQPTFASAPSKQRDEETSGRGDVPGTLQSRTRNELYGVSDVYIGLLFSIAFYRGGMDTGGVRIRAGGNMRCSTVLELGRDGRPRVEGILGLPQHSPQGL